MKMKAEKLDELLKDCKSKDIKIMGLVERNRMLEAEIEVLEKQIDSKDEEIILLKDKYRELLDQYIALQERYMEAISHEKEL